MKKMFIFASVIVALITAVTLTLFAVTTPLDPKKVINGDVDKNGSVTISDAMKIFRNVAGKEPFDAFDTRIGDLNKTGNVEISDAMTVFRFVAGKTTLPLFPLFDDVSMEYDPQTEYYTPKTDEEKLIETEPFKDFDMQVRNKEIVLVKYIGEEKNIVVPEGVTRIDNMAFYYKTSIETISLPNTVSFIGEQAFAGCVALKTINVPDTVLQIGRRAFNCCSSMESIDIPPSTAMTTTDIFSGCSSLKKAYIPLNVGYIDYRMYYYCTGLTTVVVPSNISSIGKEAFAFSSITQITIPPSVTGIDPTAFNNCKDLKKICGTKGSSAEILANTLGVSFIEVA